MNQDLGEKIRNLRLQKHWTQKQVAEKIGLDESAISQYESCLRFPTLDTLIRLCEIFYVSADFLLGITANKSITIRVDDLTDTQINTVISVVNEFRKANKHN